MRVVCSLSFADRSTRSTRSRAATAAMLALACSLFATHASAQTDGATPCLQELNDQKAAAAQPEKEPEKPNWLSRNAGKVFGGIGAVGGAALGNALCKAGQRGGCVAIGAAGGALLGSKLGQMFSEADKKRYQEATYKVALTGRPQSLTLDTGCMVVESTSNESFENRQVELALGPDIATPDKLRAVAEPDVRPASTSLAPNPSAGQGKVKVAANVPSFVMGSTDSGRYLLLGREDVDQGFVGAGYVEAKGWTASPDSTPVPIASAGGTPRLVTIGVDVPCRQISSSIRVQASNKLETYPGKVCRLPNGVSEAS
ncbi:MAG: hypothetical protein JWQ11_2673 [Rhizobacter sp.]|nr:hypothetical protein [Rhizobacter sp.]